MSGITEALVIDIHKFVKANLYELAKPFETVILEYLLFRIKEPLWSDSPEISEAIKDSYIFHKRVTDVQLEEIRKSFHNNFRSYISEILDDLQLYPFSNKKLLYIYDSGTYDRALESLLYSSGFEFKPIIKLFSRLYINVKLTNVKTLVIDIEYLQNYPLLVKEFKETYLITSEEGNFVFTKESDTKKTITESSIIPETKKKTNLIMKFFNYLFT